MDFDWDWTIEHIARHDVTPEEKEKICRTAKAIGAAAGIGYQTVLKEIISRGLRQA